MNALKQTQAEERRLLGALAELANAESDDDVRRFVRKCPGFLPHVRPYLSPGEQVTWASSGQELPLVSAFKLRDMLQSIWRRGQDADRNLTDLLFAEFEDFGMMRISAGGDSLRADLSRRQILYVPTNSLQRACYSLLQNADKAKVCGNPDCPAPYFIARKAIQRYCSPDCLKLFQRQWSRDWWERVGKLRREKAQHNQSRKKGE